MTPTAPYPAPTSILVPTDLSGSARTALERALGLARALGGTITLLHVVDTAGLTVGGIETFVDVMAIADGLRSAAQKEMETLATSLDAERCVIRTCEIIDGRAARAVIDYALEKRPSLIVMGTHGRTGLARLMLGSVAERVVREAPCDVLVVHAPPVESAPKK